MIILLVLLVVLLFGGAPHWGWHEYGYAPSGLAGLLLIVLLVVLLLRRRI